MMKEQLKAEIYVFLYQNLNKTFDNKVMNGAKIYVFLYQNLNIVIEDKDGIYFSNLCISILEFKFLRA